MGNIIIIKMLRKSLNLLLVLACSLVDAKPTKIAVLGDSISLGTCPPSQETPLGWIRNWTSYLN